MRDEAGPSDAPLEEARRTDSNFEELRTQRRIDRAEGGSKDRPPRRSVDHERRGSVTERLAALNQV